MDVNLADLLTTNLAGLAAFLREGELLGLKLGLDCTMSAAVKLADDMFLFISKTRQRAKVLLWDGTGLCIYAKRLERGRFTAPWESEGREALEMTVTELALLLEGSKLAGKVALSPAPFKLGAAQQAA